MAIRLNHLTHMQELFSLRNDKTIDNPLAKGSNRNIKKTSRRSRVIRLSADRDMAMKIFAFSKPTKGVP